MRGNARNARYPHSAAGHASSAGGRGCRRKDGYGALRVRGRRSIRAHRLIYEMFVGPVPDDMHLDHLCRNRACVNPAHLEVVTAAENARRRPTTKLSREAVVEIVALLGTMPTRDIAARFGVSPAAIAAIRCGRNWRDVSTQSTGETP
jgi:hypothetical protein